MRIKAFITIFIAFFLTLFVAPEVHAQARVSVTFDDGFLSTYSEALPILESRNILGTVYVTTGYIGTDGFMSWEQVQELQNLYGWEIGNHTATHAELPTLSSAEIANEINSAKEALQANGLYITTFASPFGAYDNNTVIEALKYHQVHRTFWDRSALNSLPYDSTLLMVQSVESETTPSQVKAWVDQAISEQKWLILVLHEVADELDPNYEYVTTVSDLVQIADYIANSPIEVITVDQATQINGLNTLQNSSFESGMDSWTTDNLSAITVDTNTLGRYPDPFTSLKISGDGVNKAHLFSESVNVVFGASYLLDGFVNADALVSGEFGFYIDEYDTNANWISGQWMGLVSPGKVVQFKKSYTPTSQSVATASVQAYLTANSTGDVYLDGVSLYDLSQTPTPTPNASPSPSPTLEPSSTPEPSPSPSPTLEPSPTSSPTATPAPTAVNLVANPDFDVVVDGWVQDWIRNSQEWSVVETGRVGIANTVNGTHLFSSMINIDPTKSYKWISAIVSQLTGGEFGFYIDEYNEANEWVSGQWKGMLPASFSGNQSINYTPSNTNVDHIRLQYYVSPQTALNLVLSSVSLIVQ